MTNIRHGIKRWVKGMRVTVDMGIMGRTSQGLLHDCKGSQSVGSLWVKVSIGILCGFVQISGYPSF